MSYLQKIKDTVQKTAHVSKIMLATTVTLAFGATMVWGVVSALDGNSNEEVIASTSDGYFSNICGTVSAPPGSWPQHNANPACQGCSESGYCSGNVVRVFRCAPGEQMSDIECRANGTIVGGNANFDSTFVSHNGIPADCWMYQVDVFGDNTWDTLQDFVVWKGNRFGDPSCQPEPVQSFSCNSKTSVPAGSTPTKMEYVTPGQVIEYTVNYSVENIPAGEASITDIIPTGVTLLEYRILEHATNNCIVRTDIEAGRDAVYCRNQNSTENNFHLYVKVVVNDPATVGHITNKAVVDHSSASESYCNQVQHYIANPEPSAFCNYKDESGTDDLVDPLERISYNVQLEIKDVAIDKLEFVDDFDESKVTIDQSVFSGLSINGWDCEVQTDEIENNKFLICHTNNKLQPVTPRTYNIQYAAVVNYNATGTIVNRITDVNGYVGGNHIDNITISNNCTKTLTVNTPEETWSCDAKRSNKDGQILKPGDELTYYIDYTAENLTNNLTINDYFPEGFIADDYSPGCGFIIPTDIFFCLSDESGTIEINGHIDENFKGTSITNRASVQYDSVDSDSCNNLTHMVEQIEPEVECMDKTADKTEVNVGDTINYTVTTEIKDEAVNELIIVDDFDETKVSIDLTDPTNFHVSASPIFVENLISDCRIDDINGNDVLHCSIRILESEELLIPDAYVLTYKATILNNTVNGDIVNTVTETKVRQGQDYYSDANPMDSCTASVDVVEPTVSCVDKDADKSEARIGDVIEYTVSLNVQGTAVDRLEFVDDYDESAVEIIADSWDGNLAVDCNDSNGVLTCAAYSMLTAQDAITPGTYTFTYQARVIADVTKVTTNMITSATAIRRGIGFTNDDTEGSCTEEVQLKRNVPSVDCVNKEVYPTNDVKVGDIVKYTINYTSENQPNPIDVIDTLDADAFEFIRFENEDWAETHCKDVVDGRIECKAEGNGSIIFYVRVLKAGSLQNDATVIGAENEDVCGVPLEVREPVSELVCVDKDADKNHVDVGENVEFTITYRNTGETALQGFVMHDRLPVGMEFVSSENNYCIAPSIVDAGTGELVTCGSETVLLPGEEEQFKITVKINGEAGVGKIITNKVTKLFSGYTEGDLESCIENVYVNLPEPLVSVTKETIKPQDRTVVLGDDAETPEDYVTYKIVVTNEGPTKLVVVPLKDIFSAHDYKFIEAAPKETSVTTYNATTIVYWENLGELEVGESKEIIVTLQALETYWDNVNENVLPNYVKVEDVIDENGVEANEDEDSDHVVILGSILGEEIEFSITKDLITENPTTVGKQVKFKIRITNTGDKEIAEIRFIDNYDTAYLKYSDFTNEISHRLDLYNVDTVNGQFIHDNLLYGKEALEPGEYIEFEMWFIAENKNGETTNWAKAIVEDKEQEDFAKVKIVVKILAKTGSNVMIPLAIGVALTLLLSKKILVAKSDFAKATTDKRRK